MRRHRAQLIAAALAVLVVGVSVTTVVLERMRARSADAGAAMVQALESQGRAQVERGDRETGFALLQRALVMRRARTRVPPPDSSSAAARQVAGYVRDPMHRGMLFTRPGDVFMMDPDGTHELRITHSPEHWNEHPAWAADGVHVLLSRFEGGDRTIAMTTADGASIVQLTAPPPGWNDMVPVPLGDGVVFARMNPASEMGFYFVRLDGSGLRALTPTGRNHDPAPDPAGRRLAYVSEGDIYVMDLRSGARTRLTRTPTQYKGGLAVSPNGRQLAFTRIDSGRLEQIFVMDIDGTNVRRVSRGDFYDFLPRWSPDGSRLAFTSSRDGTLGVYTMRLDGSDVVDVSRTPAGLAMRPGFSVLQVTEMLWAWK